jgi:hypothetical protein
MHVRRNMLTAARNRGVRDVPQHELMTTQQPIAALLFGLVAFLTLGASVLLYMTGVGADVLLAIVAALTPP